MRKTFRRSWVERLEARQVLDGTAGGVAAVSADAAEGEQDLVPEFRLMDVNPNSQTYEKEVSPRDFLGRTSAWYFGHAT